MLTGGSASADDPQPARLIGKFSSYSNLCMDVRGAFTANGTPVQVYTCNGTAAQQWTEKRTSRTSIEAFGKCLDVVGGGTADGAKVDLYTCNGTGAQNWVPLSDWALYNPNSNKCLDVPNHSYTPVQLQIWDCVEGSENQKWRQVDSSGNIIPPG